MASLLDNVFQFPNILHVQRDYNWDFILPSIGIIPGVVLSKYCQSVSFGQYNIEEIIEQRRGAEKSFFPGTLNITGLKATFIVPTPDLVGAYFTSWKKLIVDDDGYYGLPNEYKRNASIVFYDRSFSIPTNIATVKGLFPKTFPAFNLAYSSEDIVRYDIEFSFDKITFGLDAISPKTIVGKGVEKLKSLAGPAIDRIKGVLKT